MNKILVAIILSFILSPGCAILADASGKSVVELQRRAATTWGGVKCDVLHRIY